MHKSVKQPVEPSPVHANTFEDRYRQVRHPYFGSSPVPDLVYLVERTSFPNPLTALDLGCGDGRNALYIARRGFEVTAIDIAPTAVERMCHAAEREKLPVHGIVADVCRYDFSSDGNTDGYALIVANTVLDHLPREDGNTVLERLERSVRPGGYAFISVFTVDDPGFSGIGPASETAVHVKRYYERRELPGRLRELEVVRYREEAILDTQHGKPHCHAVARLVARRPA